MNWVCRSYVRSSITTFDNHTESMTQQIWMALQACQQSCNKRVRDDYFIAAHGEKRYTVYLQ